MTNFHLALLFVLTVVIHLVIYHWTVIQKRGYAKRHPGFPNLARLDKGSTEWHHAYISLYRNKIATLRLHYLSIRDQLIEAKCNLLKMEYEATVLDAEISQAKEVPNPRTELIVALEATKALLQANRLRSEALIADLEERNTSIVQDVRLAEVYIRNYSFKIGHTTDCDFEIQQLARLLGKAE